MSRNELEMFREQCKNFNNLIDSEACDFSAFPTYELVDDR